MEEEHELLNFLNKLFFPCLFDPPKLVLVLSADKPIHFDTIFSLVKVLKTYSFNISDVSPGNALSSNNLNYTPFSKLKYLTSNGTIFMSL